MKSSTNWGNLIGQVFFGILGDKLGRKKMYGIELLIVIICTITSSLAAPAANGFSILVVLAIWRFLLGIGIGGDYPMSAVITSEFANVRYRGLMIAAVFAMQGIGILVGGIVFVVTLAYMKPYIEEDYTFLDYVWRIAIGTGVIPAVLMIYFRLTIPETPRYTVDINHDAEQAERDMEKVLVWNGTGESSGNTSRATDYQSDIIVERIRVDEPGFFQHFSQWKYGKVLFGAAYCWFALDIAWYGLALNQSTILGLINYNGPPKISGYVSVNQTTGTRHEWPPFVDPNASVFDYFYQRAIGNIIIAMCGTVPGYWVAVLLIEKMGRKPIQYLGFTVISVILAILAADFNQISTNASLFVTLFTIAQFFFNFGPNTTTFVFPGEIFPTRFRATGHGLAAACGKMGAIIGIQAVGPYFNQNPDVVLWIFAIVMASGGVATMLLPETKGKTLEEISGDREGEEEEEVEYVMKP